MKHLHLLLVCLYFTMQSYAQHPRDGALMPLSKKFQEVFNENGWVLEYYLSFYRVRDTVHWNTEEEKFSVLNPLVIGHESIQDSIQYQVRGLYDKSIGLQVIDLMKGYHINHNVFVTPVVRGEFVGGMRLLQDSLVKYMDTALVDFDKKEFEVTVYFAGVEPFSFMVSISSEKDVEEVVCRFFVETGVKHLPAVWYGRPMYTRYVFDMKKMDAGFVIEDIRQHAFFFCHDASDHFYFIEGLDVRKAPDTGELLSFVYDQKWTEEEFLASDGIRRILRESLDSPTLLKILKSFYHEGAKMPYSAIYCIHIEEKNNVTQPNYDNIVL